MDQFARVSFRRLRRGYSVSAACRNLSDFRAQRPLARVLTGREQGKEECADCNKRSIHIHIGSAPRAAAGVASTTSVRSLPLAVASGASSTGVCSLPLAALITAD